MNLKPRLSTLTELEKSIHPCGDLDDWLQVIDFDMANTSTQCPGMWQENSFYDSVFDMRACSRPFTPTNDQPICFVANFPVSETFDKICGRVKAVAYGAVDGFEGFNRNGQTSITSAYVTGIVLATEFQGSLEHLWTFAAGVGELDTSISTCPCDRSDPSDVNVPDFVGNSYFCESGNIDFNGQFFLQSDDPLWDGENCHPESNCCNFNHPPYFVNDLGKTINCDKR